MRKRIFLIIFMGLLMSGSMGYLARVRVFRAATAFLPKMGFEPIPARAAEVAFRSGNLQLRGTLYTPGAFIHKFPAIVICHGGTRLGRRLALYVALAQALAQRGYVVLTFDFRGFGDSEKPRRLETFADLDFVQDVSAALTYLAGGTRADPARCYVIGHSFGAGVGVMAGIRDPRVRKAVSISPGRNTRKLFFGPDAVQPDYPSKRMSEDMNMHPPIPRALFDPHLKDYAAEAILDYPAHLPVLLVDGDDESAADRAFLKTVADQMTAPKGYVTIRAADHYFGTKINQDGSTGNVRYDAATMTELTETIDRWFYE